MFATFTEAIIRSRNTAPNSTYRAERARPAISTGSGNASLLRLALVAGYRRWSLRATDARSLRAAARRTPGFNRATTLR
jgi:hypothetical protein